MQSLYGHLENDIEAEEEKSGESITSSVKSSLKSCSDKLMYVKSVDDVDTTLKTYHITKQYIGKYINWSTADKFERFIEDLKIRLK
jgi:hypothetical protein